MSEHTKMVYFAHGKESGPWGTKITRLAEVAKSLGWGIESPDYSGTKNAEERVQQLLALQPSASEHLVLVGSSMGGYVSAVAAETLHPEGLFLMAPAFYIGEFAHHDPAPKAKHIAAVHGWNDDVVPVENTIRFAQTHHIELHLIESGHTLTDQLPLIEKLFALFLENTEALQTKETRTPFELEQESKFQRETFMQQKPRIPR